MSSDLNERPEGYQELVCPVDSNPCQGQGTLEQCGDCQGEGRVYPPETPLGKCEKPGACLYVTVNPTTLVCNRVYPPCEGQRSVDECAECLRRHNHRPIEVIELAERKFARLLPKYNAAPGPWVALGGIFPFIKASSASPLDSSGPCGSVGEVGEGGIGGRGGADWVREIVKIFDTVYRDLVALEMLKRLPVPSTKEWAPKIWKYVDAFLEGRRKK